MPDTKVAVLSAISTIDTTLDAIPIVDVSDTTMAVSGTTKRISVSQILAAGTNVVVPAGTAAAPSISFSGDSNTGIYAPAADQLSISSGGSGNATVSSTGLSVTGSVSATSTITGTQLISTLATGTAPLSINSTTLVSNLNADLLDGQHGTYYQDASNITAGTLAVTRGGTGILSYAIGDLIYASAATTLAKLASVASGSVLVSGGVATAPSWGKVELDIHVSKILPIANGGTGASTFTAGRVLFGNGTSALNTSANLFWDNGNNRLGIGTATPASALEVVGTGIVSQNLGIGAAPSYKLHVTQGDLNSYVVFQNNQTLAQYRSMQMVLGNGPSVFGANNRDWRVLNVASSATASDFVVDYWTGTAISEKFKIASDGVCTWSNVGGLAGPRMTLNAAGLGIGVVPTVGPLEVNLENGASNSAYFRTTTYTNLRIVGTSGSGASGGSQLFFTTTGNREWVIGQRTDTAYSSANSFFIRDESASATRLSIDTSGNVGIGTTTPSTYGKLVVQVNGASQSGLAFVDTNTSGRSWLIGPGTGTGIATDFGFYDNTGAQIASLYTAGASGKWAWYTNGTERLRIASDGVCTWSNVGGVAGTAMTLNGTGLGVGVSPLARVHSVSNIAAANHDWTSQFVAPTVGLLAASNDSSAWIRIATYNSNPTHDPYINFLTAGGQNWSIGIDNSDSDKLKVAMAAGFSGSNEFLTIDSSGNVGIGTATPNYKLHILNDGGSAHAVRIYGTGANASYLALNASNTDTGIIASGSSAVPINFYTGGTLRATLDASGNLGLGVTPSAKLEVRTVSNDTIVKSNAVFAFGDFTTLNAGLIGQQSLSSPYQFNLQACDTAGTAYFPLLLQPKGGQVLFGTSGTASAPTFAKFGDTNTGLYFPAADTLGLVTGGSDRVTIGSTGNVLIGNTVDPNYGRTTVSVYSATGGIFRASGTNTNALFCVAGTDDQLLVGTTTNHKVTFIANDTTRLTLKSTGQLNFVGQASDPAGAAGDVYYNSTSNKLKFYDSAWKTIPASDQVSVANGTAAAPSISFDSDTNTGMYRFGADTLGFTTGGVPVFKVNSNGSFGYTADIGGAVTQATSRTTGVTLNSPCGGITLVSAAGSASWQTFTVTNSTVEATDVVRVCQKSGTDLYQIHVTNVSAGSFKVTFATTGGTTTEQPVFNFAVIKATAGNPV